MYFSSFWVMSYSITFTMSSGSFKTEEGVKVDVGQGIKEDDGKSRIECVIPCQNQFQCKKAVWRDTDTCILYKSVNKISRFLPSEPKSLILTINEVSATKNRSTCVESSQH